MKQKSFLKTYLCIYLFVITLNQTLCKTDFNKLTNKYFKKGIFNKKRNHKHYQKLNKQKLQEDIKVNQTEEQRSLQDNKVITKGNVNFMTKNGDIALHRELMMPGPKRANDLKLHLGSAIGGLLSVKFPDVPAPVFIKQNPFYSFI